MKVRLILVGRTDAGAMRTLLDHYAGRLKPWAEVELTEVPEGRPKDQEARKREEEGRLLKALRPGEHVILLDDKGKERSSPEFAALIGGLQHKGVRHVTFVVGGAYGVTDVVRARAAEVLSLSRMTFTHQMARVVLIEQIYRAFSILRGRGYHH